MTKREDTIKSSQARDADANNQANWYVSLMVGLGFVGFVVLIAAVTLVLFNFNGQVSDESIQQQVMEASMSALPVAPRVGARAPNFTLLDTDGNQVSLSDFRSQPIVVTFFHTW